MPYDNTGWGQEKSMNLLKDLIRGNSLLKSFRERTDKFREGDLITNTEGLFGSMAYDITKIYAFFCDGEWEPSHRELVFEDKGLEKLTAIYKK